MQFFDTERALGAATSLLVAVVALTLVSCDGLTGGTGGGGDYSKPLSITGVQLSPDTTVNEPIRPDTMRPGDRIAIEGQNMNSVANVYFLGYETNFNSALASENHLIASIPSDLPFGELSAAALDTLDAIRVTNNASEAAYNDVPVLPGPPTLESMSNEHARPGREVTLYGQALYLIESITFPDGVTVDGWDAAEDGSQVTFTLPENVNTAPNGNISITTSSGSDESAPEFMFHDYRNVWADHLGNDPVADVVHGQHIREWIWGPLRAAEGESFHSVYLDVGAEHAPGGEGDFLILQQGDDRAEMPGGFGSWWTSYHSINFNPGLQWAPQSATSEPARNFAVKFEMSIVGGEWGVGTFRILIPETSYQANFRPWMNENAPNAAVSFDGWRTFTVPLSEFMADGGAGNPASTVSEVVGSDGVVGPDNGASIRFVNESERPLPAGMSFAFDHIRVVRVDGFE